MVKLTMWEFKPHPTKGWMCVEGVVPHQCCPLHTLTLRSSRIVGFGACSEGITVKTTLGSTYLLVGRSRPDMVKAA